MAHYALMVWGPASRNDWGGYGSAEANAAQLRATGEFTDGLRERGEFVYVNGLAEPAAATVVDGTTPDPIVTDGPFVESKEYINGLWIIDVPDLDRAVALAADASRSCSRRIEIRPMEGPRRS